MKATQLPLFTAKEDPKDAQVISHRLLSRAGFIRKQAAGLYTYLPFGDIVHRKIENIIREEMNRAGAVEVTLPVITPAELWEASGRWSLMGREMMRLTDRHDVAYALSPTHEEAIVDLAKTFLQSYKQLPINLYQIGKKYRDEIRPRYGLIRCREFTMKDAYSFHLDDASLDKTYQAMRECYRTIFDRCGLSTLPVEADSGNMGGSGSEEFMVASAIGEETLLLCENNACGYRSNQEKTPYWGVQVTRSDNTLPKEEINTGELTTVEDVAQLLKASPADFIKTIIAETSDEVLVAFIPGNRDLSEIKLKNLASGTDLIMAPPDTVSKVTGAAPGYAGPVGLPVKHGDKISATNKSKQIKIFFDRHLKNGVGLISGANKTHLHLKNLNEGRDFKITDELDLVLAKQGDLCPQCKVSHLKETRGIEVGHIFKLGKKYTEKMGLTVLDPNGKPLIPTMGCYGIGVGRTVATVVEQNYDDKGIIWPESITPFMVYLNSLVKTESELAQVESVYNTLQQNGISVFWDDRDERTGVKFNDAELVGFPYIVTMGKKSIESGKLEIKLRRTGEKLELSTEALIQRIKQLP